MTHANANWKGKRHSFLVSAYKCKCTDLCNFPKLSCSLPEEAFLKHISKLRCHISDKLLRVETLFAKSTFFQQPFLKSLKKNPKPKPTKTNCMEKQISVCCWYQGPEDGFEANRVRENQCHGVTTAQSWMDKCWHLRICTH